MCYFWNHLNIIFLFVYIRKRGSWRGTDFHSWWLNKTNDKDGHLKYCYSLYCGLLGLSLWFLFHFSEIWVPRSRQIYGIHDLVPLRLTKWFSITIQQQILFQLIKFLILGSMIYGSVLSSLHFHFDWYSHLKISENINFLLSHALRICIPPI